MAVYHLRDNWKHKGKPVDYLEPGDTIIIRKMKFTIKERFPWKDENGIERLVYVVDDEHGSVFWSHELERVQ